VNVSCKGGTRVEIKGVSHTGWMPELTHNEAFRQWALLLIRDLLKSKRKDPSGWKISHKETDAAEIGFDTLPLQPEKLTEYKMVLVNLPLFRGILSHFTQPGKMFGDELAEKVKVVACIDLPNMAHSEMFEDTVGKKGWKKVQSLLDSQDDDAQLILWGPEEDIPTALETIQERCFMAFTGVPNETRKSFENGTTVFERVLPGADRMYPDTDSAPIPLEDEHIRVISERLPIIVSDRMQQLKKWNVPEDTYTYILKNNLVPLIEQAQEKLNVPARFTATLFAQTLKHIHGKYPLLPEFTFLKVYDLLAYLVNRKLDLAISRKMLLHLYQHPKMDYESILVTIGFREIPREEILLKLPFLIKKYQQIRTSTQDGAGVRWVMGNLSKSATGNISLVELSKQMVF
jgi:glutamyl-tRNA(Gln) amidotransferase subunit E